MKQKLLFVWRVLVYDVIKALPASSDYFNRYFQLSAKKVSDHDSHYRRIVKYGKELSGWTGVLLANIALLLFCLPICFSADLVIHGAYLFSVKIAISGLIVLILLNKFDMLRFHNYQNLLKLFYLFSCIVSSSFWTLTCVFLAAFENIGL